MGREARHLLSILEELPGVELSLAHQGAGNGSGEKDSLSRLWSEFIERFNTAHFYEAHELSETIWAGRGYQTRDVYRGLTQVAVALAHAQKGNQVGANRVLNKAKGLLSMPDAPVWVSKLLVEAAIAVDALNPNRVLHLTLTEGNLHGLPRIPPGIAPPV